MYRLPLAILASVFVVACSSDPRPALPEPEGDSDLPPVQEPTLDLTADADGDGIANGIEIGPNVDNPRDTDADGIPDYLDTDSDGDCVPDSLEARAQPPADTDGDGRADYVDRDSDGDGLTDSGEDTSCNGVRDGTETDATKADTDGDGVDDLSELTIGTDPNDPLSSPTTGGDFVFVAPYAAPTAAAPRNLAFTPQIRSLDVYVLLDRSGSMVTEIVSIKNNLSAALSRLACPPLGTGDLATCIPDIWAGAGTIGYDGSGAAKYQNWVDLQPGPSFATVPTTEPSGCCSEATLLSLQLAITGNASSTYSQTGVPARTTCAGSPAASAGFSTFGYPCFRADVALPVVVLATDEGPITGADTLHVPDFQTLVGPTFMARGARIVSVLGSGAVGTVRGDLELMATATRAIDATNNDAPLVLDGEGANASTAVENAIRTLSLTTPLRASALMGDDESDDVDAVEAFFERFETNQLGTPECTSGLATIDSDGDEHPDAYASLVPRTPVCWLMVPRPNATVPSGAAPQVFRATARVVGDDVTQLDTRTVYFIVPPSDPDA